MMILKTTIDLTRCTEIDVALPNADGSSNHRLLSREDVVILTRESFGVPISSRASALLNPGKGQDVPVKISLPNANVYLTYEGALSVLQILPYADD